MKVSKKIAALLLSVLLVASFCGCGGAGTIHGRTILAYEQAPFLDAAFDSVATLHYKLKEGCRDRLNVMFFVSTHNEGLSSEQILVNDLYMLDLDTGVWYFDSIIDRDALYIGDSPNFETKENALMFFFDAFDQARGEPTIWTESAKLDYMSAEEIARVNQMWTADQQARVLKTYTPKSINLNLREQRTKELQEIVNQPAGWAKKSIDTIEEAIVYLNFRFPSLTAESMEMKTGADRTAGTLRSGIEILEDHQLPASGTCIATCVGYLLGDDFEIQTLIAFGAEEAGQNTVQKAINVIKTPDGYLFFDPLRLMNGSGEILSGEQLPEMECATIDAYLAHIKQNTDLSSEIAYIAVVPNGERMDYRIGDMNGIIIETDSSCAELIACNAAA